MTWRQWADDVTGHPVAGGHFLPEEAPDETASELHAFFSAALHGGPMPPRAASTQPGTDHLR
jgi:hypothetical protein